MFLEMLLTNPLIFVALVIIIILSVCLHELFHAVAALIEGDDTAKQHGHLTLNPLVHMGWTSLMLLLMLGLCWGSTPVNRSRFKHRYGEAFVSFAGPFANLLLMAFFIYLALVYTEFPILKSYQEITLAILYKAAQVNGFLFLLNLFPFPPFDGFSILASIIPGYRRLETTLGGKGFLILMLLFWSGGAKFFYHLSDQLVWGTYGVFKAL